MVKIESYEGNGGKTVVKKKYPKRQLVKLKVNERIQNIVLESAYADRYAKFGEVIYLFCHDADTGELLNIPLSIAVNSKGYRGTVWTRMAINTLLDTSGEDGIYHPRVKEMFLNKRMWIGKTEVAGKQYHGFECDFMEGEPKYDSSYDGMDQVEEVYSDDTPKVDLSDEMNNYIYGEINLGTDPLTLVMKLEDKFGVNREAALKRIMDVKGSM